MTTLAEARRIYREAMAQYQERIPRRTALLGDGRGTAASNVLVPGRDDYVFARDDVNSTRFFQVLNQGAVQPAANLPVYIGFPLPGSSKTRDEEQVLGINYSGLGTIASGTIPPVGPHHQQHEFRGGDDILLDSRQFLSGLVHPTDPISMKVQVETFIYFYDTWQRWEIGTSKDLTEYIPSSGKIIYVLIALDPEIGQLVYRPGVPYSTGAQEIILGTFTPVPAPAGNELPLGYIRLLSTTTTIDWTSSGDNIGDARLWVNPPMLHILDRIEQLEGLSGNPPDMMMMGAATNTVMSAGLSVTGTDGHIPRLVTANPTVMADSIIKDNGQTLSIGAGIINGNRLINIVQPNSDITPQYIMYAAGGAHTNLTASTEVWDFLFALTRTVQWDTGNITTQRAVRIDAPIYAFVGASTITTAATVAITGAPVAGTNATITSSFALWLQSGRMLLGGSDTAVYAGVVLDPSISAVSATATATNVRGTMTATANGDGLYGLYVTPTFAKGAFTGLVGSGVIVQAQTPSGAGTIDSYSGVWVIETTHATSNIGFLVGTAPVSVNYAVYLNSSNAVYLGTGTVTAGAGVFNGGVQVGTPTGGDKGAGTINVATNIYLNNSAYGNPDYALEYWTSGHIERFSNNPGADNYKRMSLDEIETYIREHIRLPGITDTPSGIFDRADIALEKIEELFTHLIEIHQRVRRLESV